MDWMKKSWTLYFNTLTLIVSIGGEYGHLLPENFAKYAMTVVAIANILLRFKTEAKVVEAKKSQE
jgi:hypothetical protein